MWWHKKKKKMTMKKKMGSWKACVAGVEKSFGVIFKQTGGLFQKRDWDLNLESDMALAAHITPRLSSTKFFIRYFKLTAAVYHLHE